MNLEQIENILAEAGLTKVVAQSQREFLIRVLAELDESAVPHETGADTVLRLAFLLERAAVEVTDGIEAEKSFEQAFLCRRAVDTSGLTDRVRLLHFFHMAVDGVAAERRPEVTMLLRDLSEEELSLPDNSSWSEELLLRTLRAFVFLCRKDGGWIDVRQAAGEIRQLRSLQQEREASYIEGAPSAEARSLLVRYNLARVVDIAAQYTINGSPGDALIRIDRHISNANELIDFDTDTEIAHVADILGAGARALVRGSVWFTTRTLGARVRDFVNSITKESLETPVLELWPSQRAALGQNLLDPAKRAIVVEMPTSSGKTLIAEFAIVQALALNPGSTVAYVVPTRALVNQVTKRLRQDLRPLNHSVEAAVPVFELDPTEDSLLHQEIDVLIVTPEKLDLLIRSDHVSVQGLCLVVVDEAHNLGEGSRGARLELLLGTLKRERPDARFLLLTPFVPNGEQLATWLGDVQEGSIQIRWKPSDRIAGIARFRKPRNEPRRLQLVTVPSATNVDFQEEILIDLGEAPSGATASKKAISSAAALRLAERGGVLVLAAGRKTAELRAAELAHALPSAVLTSFGESVVHYAETELGISHYLPGILRRGVTYHHAGLSHDLRYLLEMMIDREEIRLVCGTTTLAQGVNFPIASVVVETLKKPLGGNRGWKPLTYSEFWNIAGRAGRALKDQVGLVAFPTPKPADVEEVRSFLQGEAEELASSLLEALAEVDTLVAEFDLALVRSHPAVSVFMQYLAHALRVAGLETARSQLEDVLRSSLVFHQVREENRRFAEELIRFARRYLDSIQMKDSGYLALADGTGFSLSSVDYLYAVQREGHPEWTDPGFWNPESLFVSDSEQLASVVSTLAGIPELTLGRAEFGVFDPQAVAGIVVDWVNGTDVSEIADRWFSELIEDEEERRRQAGVYLYSQLIGQVPWGMGALQRLALSHEELQDVGHAPSLVFYGVRSKAAAALRMAGVPRIAAEGLASGLDLTTRGPTSFEDLRSWLHGLPSEAWESSIPVDATLSGSECRDLWLALSGAE